MFTIRVISDSDEARNVWSLLSPKNNIYEDWDFRFLFYKYFNYPFRFYVGEEDGEIVGLLALQYNSDKGYLEFFGGNFMEDNHVLVKPGHERHITEFYHAIGENARLEAIILDNISVPMDFMENKYVIDLSGLGNIEDYMNRTFSAKARSKVRKQRRDMESWDMTAYENHFEDIDVLMNLNRNNFGSESTFNKPHRSEIYHDLVAGDFEALMYSCEIGGKIEGVSLSVRYGQTFVSMNGGVNSKDYSNLGHFMRLQRIEKAIALGCDTFDAGLEDLGWKESWYLKKVPQYKFVVE